jgi:hypothetical protein
VPFRHEDRNDQADQSDDQHHGEGDGEESSLGELTATRTEPTRAVPSEEPRLATDSRGHAHDRRAISGPGINPGKDRFLMVTRGQAILQVGTDSQADSAVRFPSPRSRHPAPTKGS